VKRLKRFSIYRWAVCRGLPAGTGSDKAMQAVPFAYGVQEVKGIILGEILKMAKVMSATYSRVFVIWNAGVGTGYDYFPDPLCVLG